MSERKVLNKYYPPDYDPSRIPKCKNKRSTTFAIRIMAPFNMRCNGCGEYIYKGKKFNSRKEDVEDENYLGLRIYRFYIKCPRCVSEIAFKTDLVNMDYALEAGATRNFEAAKTAEKMAVAELKEKEDEELNNPMKVLENRTKASQREMEQLDDLEELKDMNARAAGVSHEDMIKRHQAYEKTLARLQEEHDEQFIQSLFGKEGTSVVKRLPDPSPSDDVPFKKPRPCSSTVSATDHLISPSSTEDRPSTSTQKPSTSKEKPSPIITTVNPSNSTSSNSTEKPTISIAPKSSITKKPPPKKAFTAQSSLAGFIKKKPKTKTEK